MKSLLYYLICSLILAVSSCQKEEKSVLKGCCGNEVLDGSFGNGHVYLPNIFTPNGDGVNDLFYVLGDSIRRIIDFEIRNKSGQLAFHVTDSQINDNKNRWDGNLDGIVQKGLYNFTLTVEAEDGTIGNFNGKVCNYPCGLIDGEEMISMDGCHFGIEYYWYTEFIPDPPIADFPGCFQ